MSDVFVISARRTPFRSFSGCLATVPAPQFASLCIGGGEAVANLFERL